MNLSQIITTSRTIYDHPYLRGLNHLSHSSSGAGSRNGLGRGMISVLTTLIRGSDLSISAPSCAFRCRLDWLAVYRDGGTSCTAYPEA